MSFRSKFAEFSKHTEGISKNAEETSKHTEEISTTTKKIQPRYIFLGFFSHGGFGWATDPYKANKHASVSIKTRHSIPKLMTYMNCSPGTSLIGENNGMDNVILANYFKESSDFDMMDISDFHHPKAKTDEQLLSYNFLNYINSALDELPMNPRKRNEKYRIENPNDIDVCRNSFICNGKVGISNLFPNKSFSTDDPPAHTIPGKDWGVIIYNNNCGIKPGTDIYSIDDIERDELKDKYDNITGYDYHLADIISGLSDKCELTKDDYLFLFDYSCSTFGNKSINLNNDSRTIRRLGRNVSSVLGLGRKKKGKKSTKKNNKLKSGKNKSNSKTVRKSKNKNKNK